MYKTIKISEVAYKHAESLRRAFAETEAKLGTRKISLSETVGYAINNTLEGVIKRKKLESSAGGWSDIDSKVLIKDIYASRTNKTRMDVKL